MTQDYGPGVTAAMQAHAPGRILDVEQARTAAIGEYTGRNLAARKPHEYVDVLLGPSDIDPAEMVGETVTVEQGPGYDQHGLHNSPTFAQRMADQRRAAADSVRMHHAEQGPGRVQAGPLPGDAELETRVRSTIYLIEQSTLSRRFGARQIINTVREHDRRVSHEGATETGEVTR